MLNTIKSWYYSIKAKHTHDYPTFKRMLAGIIEVTHPSLYDLMLSLEKAKALDNLDPEYKADLVVFFKKKIQDHPATELRKIFSEIAQKRLDRCCDLL